MSELTRDPFTNNVIHNIPEDIRATFSEEQFHGLQVALGKIKNRRHLIDMRMVVPLYWARYYVVFLVGRDLRSHVQDILINRRQRSSRAAQIGFIALVVWLLLIGIAGSAFFALYLIKSAVGIDIFPDKHLSDFLEFLR